MQYPKPEEILKLEQVMRTDVRRLPEKKDESDGQMIQAVGQMMEKLLKTS